MNEQMLYIEKQDSMFQYVSVNTIFYFTEYSHTVGTYSNSVH